MKVLVADDSITVRKIAERQLNGAGFDVALAANGEEALAWLERERPDLIISDVLMPDKTGYDVCAFVRGRADLAATPVLLISGIVNDEVKQLAKSCRADGVLKKPFQGSSLKEQVAALLAQRTQELGAASEAPPTSEALSTSPPSGAKAYRITEKQLQAFRQTVTRVRELETLLAEERKRSARLLQRLSELERLVGQATGLYDDLRRALQDVVAELAAKQGPKTD
jgi:DNA-binding response OmpR family regulator